MSLPPAPYFDDVAGGAPKGVAHWLTCDDGVRIRVAHWLPDGPAKGTMLMFPGRTEYIEKYFVTAQDMAARGYATIAVDWRGQGIADRLLEDANIGHVEAFTDYQRDVAAVLSAAETLELPRPWHVLGHSMGGAIGLRAVMDGIPVASCAFSGPMWGIFLSRMLRPFGVLTAYWGTALGLGGRLMPTTSAESYVATQPFDGNSLTPDPEMYKMMQDHLIAHPELNLGGPSTRWLHEALSETAELAKRPSPDLPCLTFLGTEEKIVDVARVHDRMNRWPNGSLELIKGGEHEVIMDSPKIRTQIADQLAAHFDAATG